TNWPSGCGGRAAGEEGTAVGTGLRQPDDEGRPPGMGACPVLWAHAVGTGGGVCPSPSAAACVTRAVPDPGAVPAPSWTAGHWLAAGSAGRSPASAATRATSSGWGCWYSCWYSCFSGRLPERRSARGQG